MVLAKLVCRVVEEGSNLSRQTVPLLAGVSKFYAI